MIKITSLRPIKIATEHMGPAKLQNFVGKACEDRFIATKRSEDGFIATKRSEDGFIATERSEDGWCEQC